MPGFAVEEKIRHKGIGKKVDHTRRKDKGACSTRQGKHKLESGHTHQHDNHSISGNRNLAQDQKKSLNVQF